MSTLGIIQTGTLSSSATRRTARKLGGRSLLEWVVRHVTDCQRLDDVLVLCNREEEPRVRELVPADVTVFASVSRREPSQLLDVLDARDAEGVIRVRGDAPLVDPEALDRLVGEAQSHPACDYISYCQRDEGSAVRARLGYFGEWFRSSALSRACQELESSQAAVDLIGHVLAHPDSYRVRLLPAPGGMDPVVGPLAVESEEDWERAQTICDAIGADRLNWRTVASLLDQADATGSTEVS